MLDPAKLKADFPILSRKVHGKPLTYLDSAATAQKPEAVITAVDGFYRNHNANIHRGIYTLGEEATELYENARKTVAAFIGADSPEEIVFTRSTTEAINLVAYGWARKNLKKGDAILLTEMEHHANLVPWYMLADEIGVELRFASVTPEGRLDQADFEQKLDGAKLVGITHASNVLGTINPISELTKLAHDAGAKVLVDGAQAVPHLQVDMCELQPDWYAFSGHKLFGPSGIGVLRTHAPVYKEMEPMLGGGEMIKSVGLGTVEFADPPQKFEAGTMPVADAVGLAAAIEYVQRIGIEDIRRHEQEITGHTLEQLRTIEGLTVFGPEDPAERVGLVSFTVEGVHSHDLASLLDQDGIAVRSGQHCAHPLHDKLGVAATARASFSVFNSQEDVGRLVTSIKTAQKVFAAEKAEA